MRPVIADTEDRRQAAYEIRSQVYVNELGLFDVTDRDEYDNHSGMVLVQHEGEYIAALRVIFPPLQVEEMIDLSPAVALTGGYARMAEVSRFAVKKEFRGHPDDPIYHLIRGGFGVLAMSGITHYYAMIDPGFFRSVKRRGIHLERIKKVNYLGERIVCMGLTEQHKDLRPRR